MKQGSGYVLQACGITLDFGGVRAVDGFDIAVGPAEISGLIGPNGAGKTTVFNLLTGIYQPDRGSVFVNGSDIRGLPAWRVARLGAARTFQNIRLFSGLSVRDNVKAAMHGTLRCPCLASMLRLPGFYRAERETDEKAEALLRFMDLWEDASRLPGALPYGVQRRVEICRALAAEPAVLLLDEPAAGMNGSERAELAARIRSIRDSLGIAVLLIEHDMHLVMELCQTVTVADHGRCIARGTPQEVRRSPAVIEAYLGRS